MNKHLLAMGTMLALGLGTTAAHADTFLFQFDDGTEGHLWGNTYQNGNLIQSVDVGPETYASGYAMTWNVGQNLLSDIDVAVNIYDAQGLSDTWHLFGTVGDTTLNIPFASDVEGEALLPIPGGKNIFETGDWQRVLEFDVANGDHFIWEFRSDVPEPASWVMLVAGFGLLGTAMRRRRSAVVIA